MGGRRGMPRSVPGAGGGVGSGRLVTSRESLGRGAPRGGGGIGGPVLGAPKGAAGVGRGAGWSSGGRGDGDGAGGAAVSGAPALAGVETGSAEVERGAAAAGANGGASLGVVTSRSGDGAAGADSVGPAGTEASDPARPRPLMSAGSSGCLSRRSPSRSALRRTRSAWASSMLDEWLVTPIPRSRQRSNASLLVRPSSRPSSYTRIFLAKSYVNPFLGRHRRRHPSLSSHVLELSYEAWQRLRWSPGPERPARMPCAVLPARGKPRMEDRVPRPHTTRPRGREDREPTRVLPERPGPRAPGRSWVRRCDNRCTSALAASASPPPPRLGRPRLRRRLLTRWRLGDAGVNSSWFR
jgi:hypothetical protein